MQKTKMQTHIDKAYQFLDLYLPYEYANEVVQILAKKKIHVSTAVVRNVRTEITKNRLDVLNALLLFAKKNQKNLEELKTNLNLK